LLNISKACQICIVKHNDMPILTITPIGIFLVKL